MSMRLSCTIDEAVGLRELCRAYALEDAEILDRYEPGQLAEIYNGIGPDSFPDWLRELLDALHPSLAPVAFIHDVEWHESDGTKEGFTASNERFRRNGCYVAKALFPWWRPRRYAVMFDAWRFSKYCQDFGWGAWRAPYERRIDEEARKCGD